MTYNANSVDEYIAQLPKERQEAIEKLRNLALHNLPKGFSEGIIYKMIGFFVPLEIYPAGYHCAKKEPEPLPFVQFASQKNFIAMYNMGLYADKELYDWFVEEYPKHSKYKLDMGKSCVRFKKIDDIPYDLISELLRKMSVEDWISLYEKNIKK